MDSFVYIWTNITTNQKYIGVHKGTPDDGYVCSSKIMLKEYETNPSDFIRHIIAYGTFKEMYNLETKLLVEVDAAKNPNYYNQSNNNGKFYISKQSEATKEKIRKKALGRTSYNKGVPNPKQSEKMKNKKLQHTQNENNFLGCNICRLSIDPKKRFMELIDWENENNMLTKGLIS